MLATMRQTVQLIDFFRSKGVLRTFRANEVVIRADQHPPGVFYIVDGLIKAYGLTHFGEENLLSIRREHELFPLIWAITGQELEVAYRTLATTTLLRVRREQLLEFIQTNPDGLAPLMDMTIEAYRLHSERIMNLEYRTVRERLASFLLTMAQRFGSPLPGGVRIDVPLRHQDIASSINARRETTTREIVLLERKQLIRKDGLYLFTLIQPTALEETLQQPKTPKRRVRPASPRRLNRAISTPE